MKATKDAARENWLKNKLHEIEDGKINPRNHWKAINDINASFTGHHKAIAKALRYPNTVKLANWQDNRQLYKEFRFCLTMEHVATPGYITAKILQKRKQPVKPSIITLPKQCDEFWSIFPSSMSCYIYQYRNGRKKCLLLLTLLSCESSQSVPIQRREHEKGFEETTINTRSKG
jgi:hypothetical protein